MLWLNYDGGAWQDAFWYFVSGKFTWVPLYAVLLWLMYRETRRTHQLRRLWLMLAVTIVVILLADQLSSGLIKPLVERLRPSHQPGIMEQLHYVGDYRGGRYGFVSSHAANTFALAVWACLLLHRRALWIVMACFAVLNCYSRIYLGVHYPGDILCGALLGACCGWLGYWGYKKLV